jgi:hypothetical protein
VDVAVGVDVAVLVGVKVVVAVGVSVAKRLETAGRLLHPNNKKALMTARAGIIVRRLSDRWLFRVVFIIYFTSRQIRYIPNFEIVQGNNQASAIVGVSSKIDVSSLLDSCILPVVERLTINIQRKHRSLGN